MQLLKETIRERAVEFFMSKLKEMDSQTQADIESGKKELHTADFYIRKKLSGGTGIVKIITETDTLAPAVTNIDKAKFYPGQHMALSAIGIAYGYSATSDQVDNADLSSNIYKINNVVADDDMTSLGVPVRYIPVSIVNAEFTLTAGSKLIYKSRAKKFFAESTGGYAAEANDENAVLLVVPKLILAEKLLGMQLEFGQNAPALTNNHFIEVRLQGVYVVDKA